MYKLLILLTLIVASLGEAYDLVPPYHFRFGDENCWECIYKDRPVVKNEVPYFLKPPGNLAPGDQPVTLANKYVLTQTNHLIDSMKDDAVKIAKEASPGIAKSVDKVAVATASGMNVSTFSIKHNVKYDLPSGVALYSAEASNLNFTLKHESFSSSDTMSIAYKLNPYENVGIRYTDTTYIYTLFLEGSW